MRLINTWISFPRGAMKPARGLTRWHGYVIATIMASDGMGLLMSYQTTREKLKDYRRQIAALRQKMRETQSSIEPEEVKDYTFTRPAGATAKLSELFGGKDTLFVVHNMGTS